jgi:hypothetical protein
MEQLRKGILLARASPRRNIPEVEEQILPCDVLHVNFYQEYFAYQHIKSEFMKGNWEYLVLASDDIVVKPEDIIQLECDLTQHKPMVLGGMMNVEEHDYPDGDLAISHELLIWCGMRWLKSKDLPKENIFKVLFNGFSLLAIRRDIVENFEFTADCYMRDKKADKAFGANYDLVFCFWCKKNGIPIYVDKRIHMKHLRRSGRTRLGEENPSIVLNSYSQ